MKLTSDSFADGGAIDSKNAFAKHDPKDHVTLTENRSPQLAWSDLPDGTRSLVLVCVDPDAPTKPDDVNKEGRTVPFDLPRADFHHLVVVDLDPGSTPVAEGTFGDGVVAHGRSGPGGPLGTRVGLNDYTSWFSGDADMEGEYFGWDGPCPPWNDERGHRYRFTLYATDLESCPVEGTFTAADVLKAIEGHVLDKATITGTYAIYPDARQP